MTALNKQLFAIPIASRLVEFLAQRYELSRFEYASYRRTGKIMIHNPQDESDARDITLIVPESNPQVLEIWIPTSQRGTDSLRPFRDTFQVRTVNELTEQFPAIEQSILRGWKPARSIDSSQIVSPPSNRSPSGRSIRYLK